MKPTRVISTVAVTAACALGAVPVASASTDAQTASSANWAGYVVGGSSSATSYKSVSASWVAPTAKCSSGQGYSSFWVGLGGSGSDTSGTGALEQAGTEADCSGDGSASYFAWYELVPSAPVKVDVAVHPGDHITSKVTVNGTDVTIHLANTTTGATFDKTLQMNNPDVSTAEWIAEAPSTCNEGVSDCTPLSLADFGTVQFSGASATTTDGHTGTISDSQWQTAAVTLTPGAAQSGFGDAQFTSQDTSGSAGATPSSLSDDGSSFSVAWSADAGSGAGASGTSGGTGDPAAGYPSGYGGYPGSYGGYPGGYGGSYGYGDSYGYGYGYGYAYVPGTYSY